MPMPRPPVVGIDLAVTDGTAADDVAADLARHARAHGADSATLVVGVHRVLSGQDAVAAGHLAFSLRADDLDANRLWDVATGITSAAPSPGAVVLGRRRQGPAALVRGAEAAAREHEEGVSGRAVAFPGDGVTGAVLVADVTTRTAIDDVLDLTGPCPAPDDYVQLREPARPRWQFGSLVLHVLPAPGAGDGAVFVPVDALRSRALAS